MKKIVSLFILLIFVFTVSGCKDKDKNVVTIALPDGTPALALANVLDDGFTMDGYETNYNFVQAQAIAQTVTLDSTDMAIMPTVLAAKLYSQDIDIKMVSNNVFGNLYVVGVNGTEGLNSLKGNVVYTTTGTTLSMLEYILKENDISYASQANQEDGKVALASYSDASEIIPLLLQASKSSKEAYAVLGEPAVTQAMGKISNLEIVVDIQEEYKNIEENLSSYPQACLVAKTSFIEKNEAYVASFYNKLTSNKEFLESNVDNLNTLYAKYNSSLSNMTFTIDTINRCNLDVKKAIDMQDEVIAYVQKMMNITLNEGFFYSF